MVFRIVFFLFLLNSAVINGYLDCKHEATPRAPPSNNDGETRQRNNDVLDMKIKKEFTKPNELELNLFLDLSFRPNSRPPANTVEEYFNNYVKHFVINLFYTENRMQKVLKCTWSNSFEKVIIIPYLQPFTTYTLQVGYALGQTEDIFENKDNMVFRSCFGSPSSPRNLDVIQKDCNIEITWEHPEHINAPYICHYDLKIREQHGRLLQYNVTDNRFLIINPKPDTRLAIDIEAINEGKCYKSNHPDYFCDFKYGSKSYRTYVDTKEKCGFTGSNGGQNTYSLFILAFLFISLFYNIL